MNYLYHLVPENIQENILYPLNQLETICQKIYKKEIRKYDNRKHLLKEKIPLLNCLWNDVLHLTAVNPITIKETLEEIGFKPPVRRWFKINPKELQSKNIIVYLFENSGQITEKDCERFNMSKIKEYNKLNKKTIDYYKSAYKKGKRPLLFNYVPHILYKGHINTGKLETVTA